MTDPVTEECRRVRDEIVQRAGGFEGYFNQLEELDRQRLAEEAKRKTAAKKTADETDQRGRKRRA